jgi:hypothetical protein
MTRSPVQYEGFKEKLFWIIVSAIVTGVIAIVSMVWGLLVDVRVIQVKNEQQAIVVEKTWEKANENNIILSRKADQIPNELEHKQIIVQLDGLSEQLRRIVLRVYGETIKEDTLYLLASVDTIVPTIQFPIVLKAPVKKITN